jgi:hypothetical protein
LIGSEEGTVSKRGWRQAPETTFIDTVVLSKGQNLQCLLSLLGKMISAAFVSIAERQLVFWNYLLSCTTLP